MMKKLFIFIFFIVLFASSLQAKTLKLYCEAEFGAHKDRERMEPLVGGMFIDLDLKNQKVIITDSAYLDEKSRSTYNAEMSVPKIMDPDNFYFFSHGTHEYRLNRFSGKLEYQIKDLPYVQIFICKNKKKLF